MEPVRSGRIARRSLHDTDLRKHADGPCIQRTKRPFNNYKIAYYPPQPRAANRAKATIGILVDLDVGMGRTGVQTISEALKLAQLADATAGLRLDGLFCYPGHIQQPPNEQTDALDAVSRRLAQTLDLWGAHGLEARIVSGGSTPTAYQSHLVPEYTEIRPGTYIYNDMNGVRGGFCRLEDCAARIVCTVVSTAVPGQVVIDAGTKTLTSDKCGPAPDSGHGYIVEYPEAVINKLTEEHGQVDIRTCVTWRSPGDATSACSCPRIETPPIQAD